MRAIIFDSETTGIENPEVIETAVEYRSIPNFPDYRIGDDGSLWSRKANKHVRCGIVRDGEWRLIAGHNVTRHRQVRLYGTGIQRVEYLYRLVLEAFVGPCPDGMEACHYPDDDPSNCRLDNLRWDTPAGNGRDKKQHGTHRGTKNPKSKLTDDDIRAIRERLKSGETQRNIGKEFGVTDVTVSLIARNKIWTHVQ